MQLSINQILKALGSDLKQIKDMSVNGGCIDSRKLKPNALFIALPGEKTNGHAFVDNALEAGAAIALIDQQIESSFPVVDLANASELPDKGPFSILVPDALKALQQIAAYWRRQFNPKVIGITGSVGKSSTKELTASVISHRFFTLKNEGNLNNEIGLPLTLLNLTDEHEVAVLEMGFYVPGEIQQLCEIGQPHIGVITNVGTVHAERAGSIEAIARGKSELIQALPADGLAILNYDDPYVLAMRPLSAAPVFTYGLDPAADLWADEIESMGLEGIRCCMHCGREVNYLTAPLIGRHSVYTMLRASAVALALGMSWDWIFHALKNTPERLRIVTTRTPSGALLIDDTYNANPQSVMAALNLLEDLSGRKVAVLGDMLELGPYETEGHNSIGMRAAEVANELVLIGPRSITTRDAALRAGFNPAKAHWFADKYAAEPYLQAALKDGDVVLIKASNGLHLDTLVAALEENK